MIKKKTTKTKKRTTVKKEFPIKKKPVAIKPVPVFYGTEYEKMIMDICAENKFPFDYRRAKIDGKVVDFINRTKRLVIEVYNPERSWEEVQARLRTFLIERFKTKYITKDKFLTRDWRISCTTLIKRFLK